MRYLITILVFSWGQCLSQSSYQDRLHARLEQIKSLDLYDNTVVVNVIDSVDYHDLSYPYWSPNDTYYEDDMVRYKYCHYAALKDGPRGKPDTSKADWKLVRGPHPFLFLRDTATVADLEKLALDKHAYIKTYAFAALSYRKVDNLMPLIVANMGDITKMDEFTGDVEDSAYPADMMIEYELYRLSRTDKRKLRDFIIWPHKHLCRGLRALIRK
jgi:hypothetical protein